MGVGPTWLARDRQTWQTPKHVTGEKQKFNTGQLPLQLEAIVYSNMGGLLSSAHFCVMPEQGRGNVYTVVSRIVSYRAQNILHMYACTAGKPPQVTLLDI